ncbi:MAG: hypothetical protein JW788_02130 [Candidatus Omnitrophica bacterium]|nr:hypothetical protein [Candidatus Omnitrophota bacterium]
MVDGISSGFQVKGNIVEVTVVADGTPSTTDMRVGGNKTLSWKPLGNILRFKIEYRYDGGAWTDLIPDPDGGGPLEGGTEGVVAGNYRTWEWTSIPNTISNDIDFRVSDYYNPSSVNSESLTNYIIKGNLSLIVPDDGTQTWTLGANNTITWNKLGSIGSLKIEYSTSGTFTPDDYANGYVFTIESSYDSGSDGNNNYTWSAGVVGANRKISETAAIRVSNIVSAPNKIGTELEDATLVPFKIRPSFTSVSSPLADQIWYVGDAARAITWVANSGTKGDGSLPKVILEYNVDAGSYNAISGASNLDCINGTNNFIWSAGVADERSENVTIRASFVDYPTIFITSGIFKVRPKITITAPILDTRVSVNPAENPADLIKWTLLNGTRTATKTTVVDVLYDLYDGKGVDGITPSADDYLGVVATGVTASDGLTGIAWSSIPTTLSNVVRIKVVDADPGYAYSSLIYGTSAETFKTVGDITITQPPETPPAEKVTLKKGDDYLITWNKLGNFSNVAIWYATDGVNFSYQIKDQTPAGATNGQFLWENIPDTPSANIVIRVSDYNDSDTKSLSAPLAIQTIMALYGESNGGGVWAVGTSHDITWTTDGTTSTNRVRLEYSTDGGGETGNWAVITTPDASNIVNTGTFSWVIPNSISDSVKVRVVDLTDTENWVESATNIKIRANIALVSPNGNPDPALTEKWIVGSSHPIQWSVVGAMSTVRLEYSLDGGAYNLITTPTNAIGIDASSGATGWNWQIPDSISSQVKVRVVNENDSSVYDPSDYDFTVQGQLVFNPALPVGGDEVWYVDDSKTITWVKTGTIPNIKLEYSKDGNNYLPITGAENLTGTTYNWTVPDDIDSSVWLRASNANAAKPTIEAVSNQFAIKGRLALDTADLTSPTDKLRVDNDYTIRWTPTGTMGTVKLEYSTNGFADELQTYPVLGPVGQSAANLPAGTSGVEQNFTWRVPSNISNTVRLRVISNQDPTVYNISAQEFKIVGGFVLLGPHGGTGVYYEVDGSTPITWELHGSVVQIPEAKLEYSRNGFLNESQTFAINTVDADDLSYSWTIPNAIGSAVKVRISDPLYDGVNIYTAQDVSDNNFEIRGKVEFNAGNNDSPLGGETWLIASNHTLQWTKHGTIPAVKVEYSVNGGAYQYCLDAANNPASSVVGNTFAWKIPDQKSLNAALVRVTNLSDGNVVATSQPFTIRGGFTWINPDTAGQVFRIGVVPGDAYVLSWNTFGTIPTVDLEYSSNNGFSYVPMKNTAGADATAISNAGTFNWIVPDTISQDVYLRIKDSTDANAQAITVKVKIAGTIIVDTPASSVRWGVGTNHNIEWHTIGTMNLVKLEYSIDGGTNWIVPAIVDSINASIGVKDWLIPNNCTPQAIIRITDATAGSGTDPAYSAVFNITGSFSFDSPTAGTIWPVTTGEIANPTRNIVWTTQGIVASVNLRYSPTGVAPWTYIAGPIANIGTYPWSVPGGISDISDTVKIRIEDAADPETYYDSSSFTIRGDLNLTSPLGNEKWGVNSDHIIYWQRNGNISDVYISYSKNGLTGPWIGIEKQGGGYNIPNTGNFLWTVPDDMADQVLIKVENTIPASDPNDGTLHTESVSPASFKIMARFDVTNPDGGEVVDAGQDYTIYWNKWGSAASQVHIDLSTDGATFPIEKRIVSNAPNTGSYLWPATAVVNASDNISPNARVRVSDVNEIDSGNVSLNTFRIRATFTMDPTIGTVAFKVGETYDVVWNKQGNVANVLLQYSTDNFYNDHRNVVNNSNTDITTLVPNVGDPGKGDGSTRARYVWTVPDIEAVGADTVKLRVSDPNDTYAESISNQFRVIPSFTVTFPNGNADPALTDKLKVGTPYDITWTSTSAIGVTPNVKISYSTTGGEPYNKTITSSTPNDGLYTWGGSGAGVPNDISDQVRVCVEDASDVGGSYDHTAFDTSNENFKIISDFTLSDPNGGATYEVGDPIDITWINTGTVANVGLAYSTASDDFSSPTTIIASTPNDGSHPWNMPDAISYNVRFRVRSLTDDGFDISDSDFRIRGKIEVTSPVADEHVDIGQTHLITFNKTGTIPLVNIRYDINDGRGADDIAGTSDDYPYVIANDVAGSNFNWTNIPDTNTPDARIKVYDARTNPDNTDVIGISPKFNIVGNFTVVEPNGDDDFRVGVVHNIRWNWGGTIPEVKLYFTKELGDPDTVSWTEIDPAVTKNYGAGDGNNGADIRTYAWTVPDEISTTVRIKVADAGDPTVYDVSDSTFNIRGNLTLTSPVGGERWVTNEKHNITWNGGGTMPTVKLEYSNDDFVSDIHVIDAAAPNPSGGQATYSNSFEWTIPDAVIKQEIALGTYAYLAPNPVKVRISDINDEDVDSVSGSTFDIDYYLITWTIHDLLTNEPITNLSYVEMYTGTETVHRAGGGLTSPAEVWTPYGLWTTTWESTGYGEKAQNFEANTDQAFSLFLETTAIHIWRSYSEFAYNTTGDRLDVSSWVERDGSVVPGAAEVTISIYDAGSLIQTLTSSIPNAAGFFNLTWNGTGLAAGKVYTTITDIMNASGAHFKTPGSFDITTPKRIEGMELTVNSVLDKPMSEVNTELQNTLSAQTNVIQDKLDVQTDVLDTKLDEQSVKLDTKLTEQTSIIIAQTQTIDTKMNEQTTIIQTKMDEQKATIEAKTEEMKAAVNATLSSFETRANEAIVQLQAGADQAVEAGEQAMAAAAELEYTAKKYSWFATVSPDPALSGDKITLRVQGQPSKRPLLNIYSWDDETIIRDAHVVESTSEPGVYLYSFEALEDKFDPGKTYTFIVTESDTGGLVAGSGRVESMSLTTIAGLAAAAPEAERTARKVLDAVEAMEAVLVSRDFTNLAPAIRNLQVSVDRIPQIIAREGPSVKIMSALNNISDKLSDILTQEAGLDFTGLFEKALESSPTVKDIRTKTDNIQSVISLLEKLFEAKFGGEDDPVVSTSLEAGSVIFRIVAVNPSKNRPQTTDVKYYLPQEVKPKDVMETGGLDLEYDAARSIYYAYKDRLELSPGEVRIFEVEVEDIWFILQSTIDDLRKRTDTIMSRLEKTEYYEKAKEIADSIYSRLNEIVASQSDETVSRETHIGIYRNNTVTVQKIKEDIARLEKLLSTAGAPLAPDMMSKSRIRSESPTKTMTWVVIFIIIIFTGLLAGVLFFTWNRQARLTRESIEAAKRSASFPGAQQEKKE